MKKWFLVRVILCLAAGCFLNRSAVLCAVQKDPALQIEKLKKEIKETEAYIKALKERYAAVFNKKERIQRKIVEEEAKTRVLKNKKQDRLSLEREKMMGQCLQKFNLPYKKR